MLVRTSEAILYDHNPNGKKFEQPIMPADGSRSIDSDMHLVLSLPQFIFMSLVTILGIVRFVVFQGPWVSWLGNSGCNCFQFFVAALDWLHGHLKAEAILAHFLGRILPLAALLSLGSGMMTYQLACSAHYWTLKNTCLVWSALELLNWIMIDMNMFMHWRRDWMLLRLLCKRR